MIRTYIRDGKFIGSYEVVCETGEVIPCYNIATARAIKKRLIAVSIKN